MLVSYRRQTCNGNRPCRLLQVFAQDWSGIVNASKWKPLDINNSFSTNGIGVIRIISYRRTGISFQKTIQFPKPACNEFSLIPVCIRQDALKALRDSLTVFSISCQTKNYLRVSINEVPPNG